MVTRVTLLLNLGILNLALRALPVVLMQCVDTVSVIGDGVERVERFENSIFALENPAFDPPSWVQCQL